MPAVIAVRWLVAKLDDEAGLWHFYRRRSQPRAGPDRKGWLFSERGGRTLGELLSLKIEAGSHGTTVRVAGEIDLETVPSLRECLASLVGDVVVDLTDVSFVDSQAISLLISEHKRRVAAGERLVITGSSPLALRTFEITGVDQVLNLDGDSPSP